MKTYANKNIRSNNIAFFHRYNQACFNSKNIAFRVNPEETVRYITSWTSSTCIQFFSLMKLQINFQFKSYSASYHHDNGFKPIQLVPHISKKSPHLSAEFSLECTKTKENDILNWFL